MHQGKKTSELPWFSNVRTVPNSYETSLFMKLRVKASGLTLQLDWFWPVVCQDIEPLRDAANGPNLSAPFKISFNKSIHFCIYEFYKITGSKCVYNVFWSWSLPCGPFKLFVSFYNGIFHCEDEDTGDKDHTVSAFLGKVTSSPLGLKFQDDDRLILESSLPVGWKPFIKEHVILWTLVMSLSPCLLQRNDCGIVRWVWLK